MLVAIVASREPVWAITPSAASLAEPHYSAAQRQEIEGPMRKHKTRGTSWFTRFAKKISQVTGRPVTFVLATGAIVLWLVSGPVFGFSESWQLVVNTGTTIITFLMVFIVQNTQNRDTAAMQVKLDELIRVTKHAHKALLDIEELDQDELDRFHEKYEKLASRGRKHLQEGQIPDPD